MGFDDRFVCVHTVVKAKLTGRHNRKTFLAEFKMMLMHWRIVATRSRAAVMRWQWLTNAAMHSIAESEKEERAARSFMRRRHRLGSFAAELQDQQVAYVCSRSFMLLYFFVDCIKARSQSPSLNLHDPIRYCLHRSKDGV